MPKVRVKLDHMPSENVRLLRGPMDKLKQNVTYLIALKVGVATTVILTLAALDNIDSRFFGIG